MTRVLRKCSRRAMVIAAMVLAAGALGATPADASTEAFGFSVLPRGAFGADNQLTTAHLQGSVHVTDELTNAGFSVDLHVTWTGTGTATTTEMHEVQRLATFLFITRFHDTARVASATGTVPQGASVRISGPAEEAHLSNARDGSLLIMRDRRSVRRRDSRARPG